MLLYLVIWNGDLGVYVFSFECGGGVMDRWCFYEIFRLYGFVVLEGMFSGGMWNIKNFDIIWVEVGYYIIFIIEGNYVFRGRVIFGICFVFWGMVWIFVNFVICFIFIIKF